MTRQSKVEIFSAGCSQCANATHLITVLVPADYPVGIQADHDPLVADRARSLGVHALPTVVVDGKIVLHPPSRAGEPEVKKQG